ncbi:MAG: hypothetical protein KF849_10185 [Rhizobiaceae bacterium]|nr:hypothetical protein [Rhizobiaceae bacterium]
MRPRHAAMNALPAFPAETGDSVVDRLRKGIADAGLDCRCQARADAVLDRVGAEAELARRAGGLADARKMRDAIVLVLVLLGELDTLTPDEPDRSAFREIASLFADLGEFADFGAEAARRGAGQGH